MRLWLKACVITKIKNFYFGYAKMYLKNIPAYVPFNPVVGKSF
jgi:hypothetical protein